MLSQDLLKELFDYKGGNLIWKVSRQGNKGINSIAGCLSKNGYIVISLNKKLQYAHRLIYVWHYGEISKDMLIDHINGIKYDNRIENLRTITHQQNLFNTKAKGYNFDKNKNKFKAQIMVSGKRKHLGLFNTQEEASNTYLEAKKKYHIIEKK